ncbi:MAG: Rid family detoxifying hydrolase [Chlamydiales bacterium]
MKIQKIETDKAPKAIGPYSQAIKAGSFLFLSGMLAIDPTLGKIVETTIEGQTRQIFHNIEEVLEAAGLHFGHVVRMEVFLKDLGDFQAMNEVYAKMFPQEAKPARHAFQVARLPLDALIEITCTAMIYTAATPNSHF